MNLIYLSLQVTARIVGAIYWVLFLLIALLQMCGVALNEHADMNNGHKILQEYCLGDTHNS